MKLYLASASPRRRDLLVRAGLDPVIRPAHIDESRRPDESPADYARRMAEEKVSAVCERLGAVEPGVVLGADTVVARGDRNYDKPADAADARRMLEELAGKTHVVITGVCLRRTDDGRGVSWIDRTEVTFRALDAAQIERYVATGEPMDKAGGYGIQGEGAGLVQTVDGSYRNVVGLAVESIPLRLAALGLSWEALGGHSSEASFS